VPAWAAGIVLLALLGFVIATNFQHDRRPLARDTSELVEKEQTAVAETKIAFAQVYAERVIGAPMLLADAKPPAQGQPTAGSASPPVAGRGKIDQGARSALRGKRAGSRPAATGPASGADLESTSRNRFVDDSIRDWRAITRSPMARAGAWRRLGITLFLFNRPGGMAAFRHISLLPPPKPLPVPKLGVPRRIRDRMATAEASTLPASEEAALWETLYGPVGPRPVDLPALRAKLARLRLGWFEDVAAAQMYRRAGAAPQADQMSRQAHRSADSIRAVIDVELLLRVAGILLLIGFSLAWFVRQVVGGAGSASGRTALTGPRPIEEFYAPPGAVAAPPPYAPAPYASAPPAPTPSVPTPYEPTHPMPAPYGSAPLAPAPARPVTQGGTSPFSYRARMIAFVVYFGSYLLISLPLQFLAPLVAHWSDRDALRLSMAIEVVAYFPVTAVTLYALKRLAEAEQRRLLTWRETWSAVGFRGDRFGRDVLTAVLAYAMATPVLTIASIISESMFRNFHTPVHPVDLIILSTQDGVTRALLFIQAAIGAPIVEELTFRGLLFEGLRERWGLAIAAILSSAVFALSHNTLPGGFLQLWTLGFVFALVYRRNGSIVPNIFMHAIHNGLATAIMFSVFSQ
jgi:membrane protease YdiL (CAAX protease family)